MKKRFASRFIVDVIENDIEIILKDTSGGEYHISKINNKEVISQYNDWFTNIFLNGVSQTVTVFQYETKDISECEIEMHIIKFMRF